MRGLLQHLNKIIHNSPVQKENQSGGTEGPESRTVSFEVEQIAYLIYDHFWVTGSHDSVESHTDLFTVVLRNDDIQEFDS